jgi:hypothetical protein
MSNDQGTTRWAVTMKIGPHAAEWLAENHDALEDPKDVDRRLALLLTILSAENEVIYFNNWVNRRARRLDNEGLIELEVIEVHDENDVPPGTFLYTLKPLMIRGSDDGPGEEGTGDQQDNPGTPDVRAEG